MLLDNRPRSSDCSYLLGTSIAPVNWFTPLDYEGRPTIPVAGHITVRTGTYVGDFHRTFRWHLDKNDGYGGSIGSVSNLVARSTGS